MLCYVWRAFHYAGYFIYQCLKLTNGKVQINAGNNAGLILSPTFGQLWIQLGSIYGINSI